MNLRQELNGAQYEAVTYLGGPLLVVAGAGSGKTRVLTYRIAYLLQQGVAPHEILAVTFTNKAAREMRERIEQLVGPAAGSLWMGTFHATCVQILRRYADRIGYTSRFTIYDTADQLATVRECLKDLNLDPRNFEPRNLLSAISRAKNERIGPEWYADSAADFWERQVARVYKAYERKLLDANAMDFDDLLLKTIDLFERWPDVLERFQERFRHILIDEYQDTNHVQYLLVRMLAETHRNLCVVGDADQSIYKFRGADIRNILDFERDYPDAKVILLEENYRSTQRILGAANAVIRNNLDRQDKNLYTRKGAGHRIGVYRAADERREAAFLCDEVDRLRSEAGVTLDQIAVLYRTHAQSRSFEEEFMRRGIPIAFTPASGSTSAKRSKTSSVTCGPWPIPTTPYRSAASSTCRGAASATRPWASSSPSPRPGIFPCSERWRGSTRLTIWAPRRRGGWRRSGTFCLR